MLESRPARAVSPDILQRERDAHVAAVEAITELLDFRVDDEEYVGERDGVALSRRYAGAHMVADLWRSIVLTQPQVAVKNTEALLHALVGKPV